MKEIFKKVRADLLISSICCIVFGLILTIYPIETIDMFCRILSIIMIIAGAVLLTSFIMSWLSNGLSAALGAIILILGVWIFINPSSVEVLFPIVIGVILLFHGIQDFKISLEVKNYNSNSWKFSVILSVISMILGLICILNSFFVIKGALIILGVSLIYNGVSNAIIVFKVNKLSKDFKNNNSKETVDVDYKEL